MSVHAADDVISVDDSGSDRPRSSGRHRLVPFGIVAMAAALTFWSRILLSGQNSYWLDELYSVERYVVQYDSVRSAIGSLAQTSIHPPIYQFLLYFWVGLFGDGETAVRTFSNLAVTVSIFFVFQLARRAYGLVIANAAAVVYAISYGAVYYGTEARSYGLSLGVSAASSLGALLYVEHRLRGERALRTPTGALATATLCAANIGLMLTHYFNFFFIVAQAIIVGVVILLTGPRSSRLGRLGSAIAVYLFQLVVFAALWGQIALDSYRRNDGRFAAEEITYTPLFIARSVSSENISVGILPTAVTTVATLAVVGYLLWTGIRRWQRTTELTELLTTAYLLAIVFGAGAVAYLGFTVASAERYSWRYFLFILPPILTLLVASVMRSAQDLATTLADRRGQTNSNRARSLGSVIALALLILMILPDSIRAGQTEKDDWRGAAQEMAALIDSNPESSFAIIEPAFRTTPMFDYYLSQFSDDARVFATMRRLEERRGENFVFERRADDLANYDYIIVPFTHHRTTHFSAALDRMNELYDATYWRTDPSNKGMVVFATSTEGVNDD